MTDRIRSLTVVLDKEYRTDDAEVIVNAIKMTKGVLDVKQGEVAGPAEYFALEQHMQEFLLLMFEFTSAARNDSPEWKEIKEILGKKFRERTGRSSFR